MNELALLGSEVKALARRSAADAFARRLGLAPSQSSGIGGWAGSGAVFMGSNLSNAIGMGGTIQAGAGLDYNLIAGDALDNPTVAICIDRLADALPDAPVYLEHLVDRKSEKWERVDDHPALDLLRRPNDYHSDADVWGMTVAQESTRGQAFWIVPQAKFGGSAPPEEIWPVASDKVMVEGTSTEFISGYKVTTEQGEPQEFDNNEIIHFRHQLNPRNPRGGWAPIQSGKRQIAGDNAAASYQASILRNCGVLSLLVSVKEGNTQQVTPGQIDGFVTALKNKIFGEGAGTIAGLNLPLDVQKLAYSPDEMAIDKLIAYFKGDICALLGVSRRVADLGDDPTYENLTVALKDFWLRFIIPRRKRHAATLTAQFLPLFKLDPTEWRVAFDFSKVEWLQEDRDAMHERVREDYKSGIPDLFQAGTALGYEVDDSAKGVRYNPPKPPGDGGAPMGDGGAAVKAVDYTLAMTNDQPKPEVKGVTLEPWSDEEMDAMAEITEDDVKHSLATRTPEMRAILESKPEGE